MSDVRAPLSQYAAEAGLRGLSGDELERLAAMAKRVDAQVASISRIMGKEDEPAHVFRVPESLRDEPGQSPRPIRR